MKSIYKDEPAPEIPRIALRPREAAIALGMSEKSLWDRTCPRGDIPAIKCGSRVLYPCHLLRRWANQQWLKQQREAEQAEGRQEEPAGKEGGN